MREFTCIVCPVGCSLVVEEKAAAERGLSEVSVTGNQCSRGAVYAKEEIFAPKRMVTAACRVIHLNDDAKESGSESSAVTSGIFPAAASMAPVKTALPCPREKIPALLEDIYKMSVKLPIKAGDVVIANWNNEGIDVVATRTMF